MLQYEYKKIKDKAKRINSKRFKTTSSVHLKKSVEMKKDSIANWYFSLLIYLVFLGFFFLNMFLRDHMCLDDLSIGKYNNTNNFYFSFM